MSNKIRNFTNTLCVIGFFLIVTSAVLANILRKFDNRFLKDGTVIGFAIVLLALALQSMTFLVEWWSNKANPKTKAED
jgi:uncharacterized membrane protein YjdF